MAGLEDVSKAASFVLEDHLGETITGGIAILTAIVVGWYKVVLPWVWPVQLTTKGYLCGHWREPYIGTHHQENWILFSVQIEVHPRANEAVREFYLEIQPPDGKDSIKVVSQDGEQNRLRPGTLLRKNEVIGLDMAHFEAGQDQLGIVGLEQAKKKLRRCRFNLVLKVRFRDRRPIKRRIYLKPSNSI